MAGDAVAAKWMPPPPSSTLSLRLEEEYRTNERASERRIKGEQQRERGREVERERERERKREKFPQMLSLEGKINP